MEKTSLVLILLISVMACSQKQYETEMVELSYETCLEMEKDPSHPYHADPIAVAGCPVVIFDVESAEGQSRQNSVNN